MCIVYDTFDNDLVVFYGSYKEVSKYFNTSVKTIQCNVCKKSLRERRYLIEYIKKDLLEEN